MKYTHLVLHGSYGTPDENWFQWLKHELEAQGKAVIVPQFPVDSWEETEKIGKASFKPKNQTLENWLTAFKQLLPLIDLENLTIIAHSSAPLFLLHALINNPEVKLKQTLFVAPFLGKIGDIWQIEKVNESFYASSNFNYAKVQQQIKNAVVFYSDNDPYVPSNESLKFAGSINAKSIEVNGAGHFNTEAGYNQFPLLLKYL